METISAERKHINPYIDRMQDYDAWVLSEDQAKTCRASWHEKAFKPLSQTAEKPRPLHVEIGTGNGFHFAHYAQTRPDISLVGFEIKYKTLVQSIDRARRFGCENAVMVKADATVLSEYFGEGEVDKLIIHFPDPWPKLRHRKNRLLHASFFREAEKVLAPGGVLEYKTDHGEYFHWAAEQATLCGLNMEFFTEDLHNSEKAPENYVTQFESLFLRKKQPIFFFTLRKI